MDDLIIMGNIHDHYSLVDFPLVMIDISIKNHNVSWEDRLEMVKISIATLVITSGLLITNWKITIDNNQDFPLFQW